MSYQDKYPEGRRLALRVLTSDPEFQAVAAIIREEASPSGAPDSRTLEQSARRFDFYAGMRKALEIFDELSKDPPKTSPVPPPWQHARDRAK